MGSLNFTKFPSISSTKAPNFKVRFWGYTKNAHSANWLKHSPNIIILTPYQEIAQKSGGTYDLGSLNFANFCLKLWRILKILTYKAWNIIWRPILHGQAPTWPQYDMSWSIFMKVTAKNSFWGNYLRLKLHNLFSSNSREGSKTWQKYLITGHAHT